MLDYYKELRYRLGLVILILTIVISPVLTSVFNSVSTNFYIALLELLFSLILLPEIIAAYKIKNLIKSSNFGIAFLLISLILLGWSYQSIAFLEISRTYVFISQVIFFLAIIQWIRHYKQGKQIELITLSKIAVVLISSLILYINLPNNVSITAAFEKGLVFRNIRHLNYEIALAVILGMIVLTKYKKVYYPAIWSLFFSLGTISAWTGGRGQIISSYLFFTIVMFMFYLEKESSVFRITLQAVTAFSLGILAYAMLNFDELLFMLDRSSLESANAFSSSRLYLWQQSLIQLQQSTPSLLFGLGPDAFVTSLINPHLVQPHNVIIEYLMQFGLIGLLLIGLLLLSYYKKIRHAKPIDKKIGTTNNIIVAGILSLVLYGMVDGIFYHISPFMMSIVLIGYSLARLSPLPKH